MSTDIEPTGTNRHGDETHPAFGVIGASRVGWSPPGCSLFQSDLQHQRTVRISIKGASRKRDLNYDWVNGNLQDEKIEVELSEAQWASFVSSVNVGDGVPCTIRAIDGERMPFLAHDPRLAVSIAETREAADRAFDKIKVARDAYEALVAAKAPMKEQRAAMNTLHYAIENATGNVAFAAKSLTEHAENVVQRSRADVEAFVLAKAHQLGIDPDELGGGIAAIGEGES